MRFNAFNLALLAVALVAQPAVAELEFSSGERQVDMVELFTSQGCSSCPPAERWLNRLTQDDTLWKEIVPLAFHVDYWDYLGWPDPYAEADYSNRQRMHRLQRNVGSVYTPGFVVNGAEWRGWFQRRPMPRQQRHAGVLTARLSGRRLDAEYESAPADALLNVAVLGFGIETPVAAGENHGRTLPQEFVVLAHTTARPTDGAPGKWRLSLPPIARDKMTDRAGLAVWVSEANNLRPLQATGGWLPSEYLAAQ